MPWPRLLFGGQSRSPETLFPKSYEDVQEILRQAHDNATPIRASGGTFPFSPSSSDDILVDLRGIDRLVRLDIYKQTVTVESGMKLSVLFRLLETVSLSLDVHGRIPDLTVCDAIAVGAFGANANLLSSLSTVEVALSNGKIVTWSWERAPNEMRALCCGLGMTAIILSVTFNCVPLQRYTEISYLCSIRDVLEHWTIQLRSSFSQQLLWFPFSELTVMTHSNPTDKYQMSKQTVLSYFLEKLGDLCSRGLRRLSVLLSSRCHLPLISSLLCRVQFFTQWSASKHRSDFVHSLPRLWAPQEACRGASWIVPAERLPEVLYHVSRWTHANAGRRGHEQLCVAPLFIQTLRTEQWGGAGARSAGGKAGPPAIGVESAAEAAEVAGSRVGSAMAMAAAKATAGKKKPFLAPFKDEPSCTVWYDWFMPECDPDPISLASFEEIFLSVGGVRAWSGERLTSPLVLADSYERDYSHWCRLKTRLDPGNYLQSAYVHGTVYAPNGIGANRSESVLSLCSSVMDLDHFE